MVEELEWQTRKNRIDGRLQNLGWDIVRYEPGASLSSDRCYALTEFETDNGPADYALCVDGQILGLVQAHVAMATANVQQLRWTVLAKAFRGELVPTEADLARREGGD